MSKTNHKLEEKFVGAAISRPHFGETAKKENGITLIALIITIIVMLILTGVTLSITLGDNGLVNKAKEATTQTQVAMDRELLLSAVVGAIGNDGKVNLSAIVLPEGFTGSNGTYTSKNGNAFTVSENGEILYTGETGSGNETEIENVDLRGKYYFYPNVESYYIEIIDDNSGLMVADGEEIYIYQTVINHSDKTVTMTWEEEFFDNKIYEIVTETYTMAMKYELVIENNEIVNIILIYQGDDADINVYWQNEEGFEYDLNGTYSNGEESLTFTEGNMNVESSDGYTAYYFKCNEQYYYDGMTMTVDDSKENIGIYGGSEIFTKQ